MAYVVSEACIKCKLTDCVEVCPVDCFHEGENMLVIDAEERIDCTLCEPECPIGAIYSEGELPPDQVKMIAVNAEYALKWRDITEMKAPPEEWREWEYVENKYPEHFSPNPAKSDDE
ncbi:MAG: ferredoxin family protein [Gammaproteobacteria bacterium]|nr:ferredoxin family protein [Gammaproteobacteria bacterium]